MNVERLHRILIDLNSDSDSSNIVALLKEVQTHLQNQVSQPNQPAHQTNLVASLNNLYSSLESSGYNDYSPGWKAIISEINNGVLQGIQLKKQIEDVFSSNVITPAKALEDISEINEQYNKFQSAVSDTLNGFEILGIEQEQLEPGECEFGYTIPREFVDNKLCSLKDEIAELNFILNQVSEAVTGEKVEYEVKTLSSSDFLLYIIIGLQVADVLSKAVERILNHYKQILEIKELRNQLKEKGIPGNKTRAIENHVNSMMEDEIKKIAKEVINEHYKGEITRKNELENGLKISLNKLANRIDNGFNIEVRVEPLKEKDEEEIAPKEQKEIKLINSIMTSSKNIEFMETTGESILELPENGDL